MVNLILPFVLAHDQQCKIHHTKQGFRAACYKCMLCCCLLFMMFLSENRNINIYVLINTSMPANGLYVLFPLLFTLSRVVLTVI